ncbi:MAG TPA: XrtA/PEP-CTERM system TPR-repeat protein PrsT, partial [Telluria sp.]|nr:XrtA/PEP-CTERM system TPR-repeat protein PrsT [Telluria sp.]
QGKVDEAMAAYDKVLAIQPLHRTAHLDKAYLLIATRKLAEAKTELDAARKSNSNGLAVLYTQALLDFTDGKPAVAKESLLKLQKVAPDHMPSILLAAAVELALNNNEQAEQHLRKYLAANPDNVRARKMLASALLKARRPGDAIAALQPALAAPAQDPELLAIAGEAYMGVSDFKTATSYFEKAAALAPKAAAVHTALGLSKLAQGDGGAAVTELELATTLDTKSPKAGYALVLTEMRLKHYDKALAAVTALEKTQPADPAIQDLKGGVYLSKDDMANARASFEKALALQPTFTPSVINLAKLDLREKKPDAAKQRFVALLEKDKKNVGALNALADLALLQQHIDEATGWLERANNENPDAVEPAIRLASQYLRVGQKQKALTLARKYQTANGANPDLLDLLGQAQLQNGDAGAALETYSKLVNVVPKSAPAQFRLASTQMMMSNETGAAESLKKALALQPDYLPAQNASVELAARSGKWEQALAMARQIQKQAGREAVGLQLEGDVLLLQKKPEPALQAFEKAYALNKSATLIIRIHSILAGSGKQQQAEARLAQWQQAHPANQQVGMYLGEIYISKKQYQLAIDQLQAVLKQNPTNVLALNNLAWAYQEAKEPRALQTAEQAYQLAGDNPAVMDTLGWVLVEQGNTSRGLPLLQKAVALAPNASDIRYHLAAGLHKSGDTAGARKELDQVLAKGTTFPQIEDARVLRKQLQ